MLFLGTGLAAGYLTGVESELSAKDKWTAIWMFGLLFGLVGGFGVGLLRWLRQPADHAMAVTPRSVLKSDRTTTPVVWLLVWVSLVLMWGLFHWFITVMWPGPEDSERLEPLSLGPLVSNLLHAFAVSLTPGLFVLAVAFFFSGWGWFTITRTWLALRGQTPWRLMTFLDDAHHRGILRQTGATYQFRHIILQERLAIDPFKSRAADGRRPEAVQQPAVQGERRS